MGLLLCFSNNNKIIQKFRYQTALFQTLLIQSFRYQIIKIALFQTFLIKNFRH